MGSSAGTPICRNTYKIQRTASFGSSNSDGNDPMAIASDSGGSGGNPRRTLVRQIVSDGELYIDFVKDRYDRNPLLQQEVDTPEINSIFQVDMRNSGYSDINTPGTISSITSLADDYQESANFNYATDTQNTQTTAGRFTYTDGAGPGGSEGTYSYVSGDFDAKNVAWESYFDHVNYANT